jgi:hypothetical protein
LLATFGRKTGHLPIFAEDFVGGLALYGRKNGEKLATCPLFAHFYFKTGQAESLVPQGFAGFLATCPLFLFTIMRKNS